MTKMFRISKYMQMLRTDPAIDNSLKQTIALTGPVVIWNLIRRCNLTCKHCYSISADKDFQGELSTEQVFTVLQDLRDFGSSVLILSGGEPLLRPDIFTISAQAKKMGFYVGLSSNGTLINKKNIAEIAEIGYDYVGISIDGMRQTHDKFRRKQGCFDQAMAAIALCRDHGIKVGMRFTLTQDNAHELEQILDLMELAAIDKFYLSHLNYAGRGNKNRGFDVEHQVTRQAMDLLFERCWQDCCDNKIREYVTGNNDADSVYLLHWVKARLPQHYTRLTQALRLWGGNASGVNIANIDNLGNVHPDTFWWHYSLGNVLQRPFSQIWQDTSDPLMAGLKSKPRPVKGRCGQCAYLSICAGNTRVRAHQLVGDYWAADPACYLTEEEIARVEKKPIVNTSSVSR